VTDDAMNQVTGRDTVAVLAGSGGAVYRLRRYLAKYGPRAAVHRALDAGRCALVLDETHVWYELGTGNERPRVDLPVGTTFVRADAAALPLIERLPTVSQAEAKRRVAAGNDLWFVLDGRQPAFACWTFSRSMPMLSAPGGELVLAAGVVCLEDSVTAPEH
jgi:hypothetical protein